MAGSIAYVRMRSALYEELEMIGLGQIVRLADLAASLNIPARHAASILARISAEEQDFRPWWRVVPSEGRFPIGGRLSSRQRAQIGLLAEDDVSIAEDGSIHELEQRLTMPTGRNANRIWLASDQDD